MEIADRSEFKRAMNQALGRLDPARTVALTVDMQREYLDESVGQSVVEPAEAQRVLNAAKRFLDEVRSRGVPVIHAYVVRRPEELAAGIHTGGLAYNIVGREIGASQLPHRPVRTRGDREAGSPESEVPAELVAPGDVHVTTKKNLDSFSSTDLDFLLRRVYRAKYLLIGGINTDTCVYSTTFTAANLGYWPIVVSDCVASMRGRDSHVMALELMARSIAWVLSVDDVLARLG
ncbi:MAG: isochorismatase [Acidimicrobiia bacterium]|nr:MAG: isochorismatase [Acidimicrobiia bacterium]